MTLIDGATIEWRALCETAVIPLPSRGVFRRNPERMAMSRWYPFDLTGCRIDRVAAIGAVLVTPPGLPAAAADRPVPALAIARSVRVRRSLSADDAVYRFGTPRGYDYYQFRRRRLVACWSTVRGDSESDTDWAPSIRVPRRIVNAARAVHRRRSGRHARIATVVLAVAAGVVQIIPEGPVRTAAVPTPTVRDTTHALRGAAVPRSPVDHPHPGGTAPFVVLNAAAGLFPDLQIRSFSAGHSRYRWQLETPHRSSVEVAALAARFPDIDISVRHHTTFTTISLEGTQ
ncbi:MAG: hypothetical protein ACOCYB_10810 [Alkalispirochaeta sp.]